MASLNVPMPDPMKKWCSAQAQSGRYSTPSEYVRDLIRRDQERHAQALADTDRLIEESIDTHRSTLEKLADR